MAVTITHAFSQSFSVTNQAGRQWGRLGLTACYAQGGPVLLTIATALMDEVSNCTLRLVETNRFC